MTSGATGLQACHRQGPGADESAHRSQAGHPSLVEGDGCRSGATARTPEERAFLHLRSIELLERMCGGTDWMPGVEAVMAMVEEGMDDELLLLDSRAIDVLTMADELQEVVNNLVAAVRYRVEPVRHACGQVLRFERSTEDGTGRSEPQSTNA